MIIGLTGSMGCGKGEIVKIFEREGFRHITLSSIVREEARAAGISEEREELMEIGNRLRREEGAGVLAARARVKIEKSGHDKWVIDGIRNPAEIDELRKSENVYIIGVRANRNLLVKRILGRRREGDNFLCEEIVAKIERELGRGEPPDGQQVAKCMDKADFIIDNEGALEELEEKVVSYYNTRSPDVSQDGV